MVFCYIIHTGPPDLDKRGWSNRVGPILTQNVLERVSSLAAVHLKLEPQKLFQEMTVVLLFLLTEPY